MEENNTYDIAIIGGGPAGSTAANYLAPLGLKIVVFEKEKFPRPHVGESLLPFCYDIFEDIGVLNEMTKRFPRKPGAIFSDHKGQNATTYCFKHVVESPKHLSFHVRRGEFDKMLLDKAEAAGVEIKQECKVGRLNLEHPDCVSFKAIEKSGAEQNYTAKFVIDASGRDGVIAKQEKTRRSNPDLKGLLSTLIGISIPSLPKLN